MPRSTLASHESRCKICRHPERKEIEREFVNWASPKQIATDFKVTRKSIYQHAQATDLASTRQRNVRRALERIIEHASDVKVNAYAVVQAISAYARINARGEWVQRSEIVNLNKLFDKMTADELEHYARDGNLPEWFPAAAVDQSNSRHERSVERDEDQIEDQVLKG